MDGNMIVVWIFNAIIYATVLSIASLGETINEKVGHLNLGVPGIMYLGGICSYLVCNAYFVANPATSTLGAFMFVILSLITSFAVGAIMGVIYSIVCVTFKCNQNVMGLAISTFGVAFGKFLALAFKLKDAKIGFALDVFSSGIPVLKDLPVAGKLLFSYGFLTYAMVIILILAMIFFRKTRVGLNIKAIGESPSTADSAGIPITKYKYICTIIGCGLCGVAGMAYVFYFQNGLWTISNGIESIGWLAIALVIFASWRPIHLLWGAPLFGFLYWSYNYLPSVISFKTFPGFTEIMEMLPYFVTIVILVINSLRKKKENQPPESLGLSYFREER